MRITTSANSVPLLLMGMATTDTMPPKTVFNSDEQKLSPTGQPLYSARGLTAMAVDDQGRASGADPSVTVSLVHPQPINVQVLYRLTGTAIVTHYVQSNGRLGVSIIADSIEPVPEKNRESK